MQQQQEIVEKTKTKIKID